jgi:hypothetical protein
MEKCTITLNSLTYAIKAQRKLQENYIYTDVVKLDSRNSRRGCSYGIEINCNDQDTIRDILNRSRISVKNFYQGGGGERI